MLRGIRRTSSAVARLLDHRRLSPPSNSRRISVSMSLISSSSLCASSRRRAAFGAAARLAVAVSPIFDARSCE